MRKRILSLLLCVVMLFSLCPQSALAVGNGQAGGVTAGTSGLCEHHPEHNADCGYTEGTAGTPCVHEHTADCYEEVTNCVHEHDEDCYPEESVSGNEATPSGAQKREPENCLHICDEESGCITKELNCQHEHDDECGYSPATAGTPCGYVCELCGAGDNTPSNAEAVTVASVQAMIDGLPNAEEITEENAEEVEAQLDAIDEAKEKLSDEEIDELDMTRYAEAAAALGALAAPMLLANDSPDEQFSLKPGDTYYFDLSGVSIPGTANSGNSYGAASLPDTSLHYVPFTYAGTIEAYKLTSAMATTEEYAQQNKYAHSLFVADYAVTRAVSWDDLNTKSLIFGKDYVAGGVGYTLRAPSVGSNYTGSGDSERGTPTNNEWDTILDKNSGYIQNWNKMYSWGQDTYSASHPAVRGYDSARYWKYYNGTVSGPFLGFRPVLEVLNADTLGSDGLEAVTLDLNGGKLGGSSGAIQIIVKTGSEFTAPASDGLTRPAGDTGSYFVWLGSNGKLYAPGASVPADVTKLTAQFALSEQFSLAPGSTYYFDLSGANIPGDKNGSLPDGSLHWVPFTYAGTVNAYVLKSRSANDNTARGDSANAAGSTDPDNPIGYTYDHSLFIADYNVTRSANWHNLNAKNLIFGKAYTSSGVDYTLRVPSAGSGSTGSKDSERGTPLNNEWDAILDKANQSYQDNTVGYIKNWNGMYSWGQDTQDGPDPDWNRATRGSSTARSWQFDLQLSPSVGFRPVLELPSSDTLGSDGLKAITLDLNGGKIGGNSDDIQIIVKNGSAFTAPASGGLTRPDGDTGSFFMWLGSDGKLYAPGANVPADVTKLTAQFTLSEQFSLTPGGVYYFDLFGENIPGTVNTGNSFGATSLPDTTLHYVPFTYAGTIEAYKLTSAMAATEEYAQQNKYPHSLFVANYAVTHTVSWYELNAAGLIFGKSYTGGSVDYTLRAPSVGSNYTGSGNSERGVPQSNEWDTMLNKDSGYIQNWNEMYSWGQDTVSVDASTRAVRGYSSARIWNYFSASDSYPYRGFRPVLEVLNPDTLGSDGMKVVTLDLGGGKLGGSADDIQIIVKNGSAFTAPASGGLTRPDGDTGSFFMWLGSDGKLYAPGASVPADVTELTVQWTAPTYAVTLHTNGGTINNGNVTEYTYGVGATLPTADDMTYTGHTFKGWYDNKALTGTPVTAISDTETGDKEYWAKWEVNTYTVTFYPNGGSVNPVAATTDSSGKLSSLPTPTRGGNYRFDGWYTEQTGGIKVTLNQVYTADTTLYAYWIYTSGSSSSEDRDDPSGNAFITDRPNKDNPTTPTTAKSNSVKVDSKGNAVITRSIVADVISVAQSDSIKHGNTKNGIAVVVPVEISKALAGVQITLKADALDKLVSSGVKRFTIDTDSMADFGFMLDTLKELNRQTTGDLILKMKKTAVTSQEVETAIGNRPVYDITLWEVKNGKETAVNLSGKTVSIAIPYTPAKNEQPGNLYAVYVDENGNVQWISKSSYNMDQKAVIFVAEHFSIYGIGYKNQIPAFTDVNNHWAKDNMLFVVSRGLLSGTSATTFSPNTGMTRGMFVTALGRLAGVDPTDYQASMFTDVKEDAYYAPYVNWAAKTGVVSGTTDTTFAPDTNINREQMAVIMKNYATKLGYTIPKTLEVVNFADSAGISSWAKEAVKSMQQAGILAGKTNNCFDPAGTATRAEVATVLRRFVEIVIDPQTANGWVQNDSGEWSYYKNGDLVKGWLSNDQKWYWLDKNTGKMFSGGWKQIDGKQYYFYADGSMAVNTTVDGKTIGADGARK
ncbi:S-layer homology domain-containing protein [Ruminococcaceae bacterium D5]|nr:S-layer homology domain-containing protein [Ruminococcaceae bacterium D5]